MQLISEAQATTKTCPVSIGRDQSKESNCQGGACMAWRAVKTPRGPEGYCGMAGRPPAVDESINRQTIAGLIERASDLATLLNDGARRRLLVPN